MPTTSAATPEGLRYVKELETLLGYYDDRGLAGETLTRAEADFLVALARYRFAPPDGTLISGRAHVVIFGGAGSGKSTAANILAGTAVAEVNAQAGYTRHPIAYFREERGPIDELLPRRLGRLARSDSADPGNMDEDIYGWRRLEGDLADTDFLRSHVVWDCPDLTTKDAVHYQSRVIEIAGLAHIGLYVASDERYNDELPTNFLQALLDAGKSIVVALTKVSPTDAAELTRLFQDQVLSRLRQRHRVVAVITIPSPPDLRLDSLWTEEFPHGRQLRDAIARVSDDPVHLRADARQAAGKYLTERQTRLLEPLRRDLGEWRAWAEMVRQQANESAQRFEREYLRRFEHRQFQDALARLQSLFALPGQLSYLWQALELARTPYRLLKRLTRRFVPSFGPTSADPDAALDILRRDMIESLLIGTATRKGRHPLWREIHAELESSAPARIEPVYQRVRQAQRQELDQRLATVSASIPQSVESNAAAKWGARLVRAAADLGALWAAGYVGYHYIGNLLSPLSILLMLAALGGTEELVDWIARQYVHSHREGIRHQQREQVRELIRVAYIEPLLLLPEGKGARLIQLAELAERLPRDLQAAVAAAGRGAP